jgi:hypothetical protein
MRVHSVEFMRIRRGRSKQDKARAGCGWVAFAMAMNVEHNLERNNLNGKIAGYRVRRAQNGLVLVPADGDEEIFVGVKWNKNKEMAEVLGWLRGSEGKTAAFYHNNYGHPCSVASYWWATWQGTPPGNATILQEYGGRGGGLRWLNRQGKIAESHLALLEQAGGCRSDVCDE